MSNNNQSTFNTISHYLNQLFLKGGLLLIGIAIKSAVVMWILNMVLMQYGMSLQLAEVFLSLVAIAIIGTCWRDTNGAQQTLLLATVRDTLLTFGSNQLAQNQQIIAALSLILKDKEIKGVESDSEILTEDTNRSDE